MSPFGKILTVNLAKLIENGTISASDLINALPNLYPWRCLIEQQGSFTIYHLYLRQYGHSLRIIPTILTRQISI
jgi:hypothetical protein